MKKSLIVLIGVLLVGLGLGSVASIAFASPDNTVVVTFDDLAGRAPMPTEYGGLTWDPTWYHYDRVEPFYYPNSILY